MGHKGKWEKRNMRLCILSYHYNTNPINILFDSFCFLINKTLIWNDILSQVLKHLPESLFSVPVSKETAPRSEPICMILTKILQTATLPGALFREGRRFIHTLQRQVGEYRAHVKYLTGKFWKLISSLYLIGSVTIANTAAGNDCQRKREWRGMRL